MERLSLEASFRDGRGKNISRRLRVGGQIPAVLYGKKTDPIAIQFDPKPLQKQLRGKSAAGVLIDLNIAGEKSAKRLVMLKDVQRHAIHRTWQHADFLEVQLDQAITVSVPLSYEGKAKGLVDGGIVEVKRRQLEISCLPDRIPESVSVDISELEIGTSLHIGDVKVPEGVKVLDSERLTLVTVVPPGAEEVAKPAVEEAADGAAATGDAAAAATPENKEGEKGN